SAIKRDTGLVDEELSEIGWFSAAEATELDLPPITRVIIEDLADRLAAGPLGPLDHAVPYYHQKHGVFRRDLLEGA
ncbi:MAG: NUDIX hydrolase, partial [Hyphomicrobiaceae bacterium]|nr:NUDIX hydrolase [Hyphomicrobiaceae bacterium]